MKPDDGKPLGEYARNVADATVRLCEATDLAIEAMVRERTAVVAFLRREAERFAVLAADIPELERIDPLSATVRACAPIMTDLANMIERGDHRKPPC